MTGLMYNRRVSKSHPRVEACGAVDELNAALGLARAELGAEHSIGAEILSIQKTLVLLMGEMATMTEDRDRYVRDGFQTLGGTNVEVLDGLVAKYEANQGGFKGWAMPGETRGAAALDFARVTCRRVERRVEVLMESGEVKNRAIGVFLNRLSDVLWLMARAVEGSSDLFDARRHGGS
jgi:cob(I)alamin adenosyltransferase